MQCPNCQSTLRPETYEGFVLETCPNCDGEWLDADELGKAVRRREEKFDPETIQAIADSTTITGVKLPDVDRDLTCPKCGGETDAVNYGGDTGIIIDKCTDCGGIWLSEHELENIQMLIEGWEDKLPEDRKKYADELRRTAREVDEKLDVRHGSVRLFNSIVNGIVDVVT